MNASMSADNLALQYENKQLGALIKDYEATLETVMDQFRNRAVSLPVAQFPPIARVLIDFSSTRSKNTSSASFELTKRNSSPAKPPHFYNLLTLPTPSPLPL